MNPKFCCLLLLTASAPVLALDLDGFQPAKGQYDIALSATLESYDEFWVGTTKVADPGLGEVETQSLALWTRWGVTDRIAVIAALPFVDVEGDGLGGLEDSGVQDLTALAQFHVANGQAGAWRWDVVVGGGVRAPIGSYEGNAPVSLGDDTTDLLTRATLLARTGSWFLSQQVGFELRGDDAPNGWGLRTEIGHHVTDRVTASGWIAISRASGGTDIGDPGFTFPSNQEEWDRVGAKLLVGLNDTLRLSAGGFATLDGRNTGKSTGFNLGLVATFE